MDDSAASRAVAALLEKIAPNPLDCRVCAQPLSAGTTALLPCCHGFHRACLAQQAEEHAGAPLRCGVCAKEAAAVKAAADVDALPKDWIAEAQLAERERVPCRLCEEEKAATATRTTATRTKSGGSEEEVLDAVALCKTCGKPLCQPHLGFHKMKRAFADHAVEPLPAAATPDACSLHGRAQDIYCVTDRRVCCPLCLATVHPRPEHETVVLAEHAPELRTALAGVHTSASRRSQQLVQRLVGLQTTLNDVDVRTAKLEETVRRTVQLLVHQLERRQEELLLQIGAEAATERAALEGEQGSDQQRWLTLEGALRAAKHLSAAQSNVDHLGRLTTPVQDHLTAAAQDDVPPAPPAKVIDFVLPPQIIDSLKTMGSFVERHAFGPECVAEGPNIERATVTTGGSFTVTAWTRSKERITVGGDHVTARLVRSGDTTATEAAVVDAGDGTYAVTYAVHVGGEYRLDVRVNDRPVKGAPFTVSVAAPRVFTYTGPPHYDSHGVIYHLATAGGTRPEWTNPHDAGVVTVSFSSDGGTGVQLFVGNKVPEAGDHCHTANQPSSWMCVSLNGKRVVPSGYVLSTCGHGIGGGGYLLRTWRLEGSMDGTAWTTLREHPDDGTLTQATPTGFWTLNGDAGGGGGDTGGGDGGGGGNGGAGDTGGGDGNGGGNGRGGDGGAFSHFRILQTGPNTTGNDHLMASSFEVYGKLLDV